MNAKISVFVICVEAIIYLLLYNLHDFTFKRNIFISRQLNFILLPPWLQFLQMLITLENGSSLN